PVTIDAKGNFWGSNLGDVESKELNLKEIWDGKDFGPVTYEGFGDETYRVDIVDISGWRKVPVDNAGVREKGKQ
ncbi:MAG: hypothetical protein GTO08_12095, partial [Deltaproteobacteria bacterium]|nr:hypothetical protein [Deltaproteobacteria bacterium]